jgi:hypothetical protein
MLLLWLADEIDLAKRYTVVTQDVVGRGHVKMDVWQGPHQQVARTGKIDLKGAGLHLNRLLFCSIDLVLGY